MDWKDTYFNESYISFYADQLTDARATIEVDFVESLFDKSTHRVLDLPCGYGRHSILLAQRGYEVVGVDFYSTQLDEAKRRSASIKNLSYELGDMREYQGNGFDVVLNLFSSFGYFDRVTDIQVFQNLIKCARVGGQVIIDVKNPISLLKEFIDNDWSLLWSRNGISSKESFDPLSGRYTFNYKKGAVEKTGTLNIYFPADYLAMCKSNNCKIEKLFGDFDGSEYIPKTSRRLIMIIRRS